MAQSHENNPVVEGSIQTVYSADATLFRVTGGSVTVEHAETGIFDATTMAQGSRRRELHGKLYRFQFEGQLTKPGSGTNDRTSMASIEAAQTKVVLADGQEMSGLARITSATSPFGSATPHNPEDTSRVPMATLSISGYFYGRPAIKDSQGVTVAAPDAAGAVTTTVHVADLQRGAGYTHDQTDTRESFGAILVYVTGLPVADGNPANLSVGTLYESAVVDHAMNADNTATPAGYPGQTHLTRRGGRVVYSEPTAAGQWCVGVLVSYAINKAKDPFSELGTFIDRNDARKSRESRLVLISDLSLSGYPNSHETREQACTQALYDNREESTIGLPIANARPLAVGRWDDGATAKSWVAVQVNWFHDARVSVFEDSGGRVHVEDWFQNNATYEQYVSGITSGSSPTGKDIVAQAIGDATPDASYQNVGHRFSMVSQYGRETTDWGVPKTSGSNPVYWAKVQHAYGVEPKTTAVLNNQSSVDVDDLFEGQVTIGAVVTVTAANAEVADEQIRKVANTQGGAMSLSEAGGTTKPFRGIRYSGGMITKTTASTFKCNVGLVFGHNPKLTTARVIASRVDRLDIRNSRITLGHLATATGLADFEAPAVEAGLRAAALAQVGGGIASSVNGLPLSGIDVRPGSVVLTSATAVKAVVSVAYAVNATTDETRELGAVANARDLRGDRFPRRLTFDIFTDASSLSRDLAGKTVNITGSGYEDVVEEAFAFTDAWLDDDEDPNEQHPDQTHLTRSRIDLVALDQLPGDLAPDGTAQAWRASVRVWYDTDTEMDESQEGGGVYKEQNGWESTATARVTITVTGSDEDAWNSNKTATYQIAAGDNHSVHESIRHVARRSAVAWAKAANGGSGLDPAAGFIPLDEARVRATRQTSLTTWRVSVALGYRTDPRKEPRTFVGGFKAYEDDLSGRRVVRDVRTGIIGSTQQQIEDNTFADLAISGDQAHPVDTHLPLAGVRFNGVTREPAGTYAVLIDKLYRRFEHTPPPWNPFEQPIIRNGGFVSKEQATDAETGAALTTGEYHNAEISSQALQVMDIHVTTRVAVHPLASESAGNVLSRVGTMNSDAVTVGPISMIYGQLYFGLPEVRPIRRRGGDVHFFVVYRFRYLRRFWQHVTVTPKMQLSGDPDATNFYVRLNNDYPVANFANQFPVHNPQGGDDILGP